MGLRDMIWPQIHPKVSIIDDVLLFSLWPHCWISRITTPELQLPILWPNQSNLRHPRTNSWRNRVTRLAFWIGQKWVMLMLIVHFLHHHNISNSHVSPESWSPTASLVVIQDRTTSYHVVSHASQQHPPFMPGCYFCPHSHIVINNKH